jgi:tungstate transport system ATP-binding protein
MLERHSAQADVNGGGNQRARAPLPDGVLARFDGVGLAFAGVSRLSQLSFDIPAEGLLALLGPNGAGKSLCLRVAAGLDSPQQGRILWQPGTRVSWVAQKPILLRRSVWSNLIFALKLARLPAGQRSQRAKQLLALAGLDDRANQPARSLSGGEQQRLALVRALASDPHILLLDEPTASMDPANTRAIEALIQTVKAQGTRLVMVTHGRDQARRLADQVVFLHQGRLIEQASADAFFDAPQSDMAAAYLAGRLLDQL